MSPLQGPSCGRGLGLSWAGPGGEGPRGERGSGSQESIRTVHVPPVACTEAPRRAQDQGRSVNGVQTGVAAGASLECWASLSCWPQEARQGWPWPGARPVLCGAPPRAPRSGTLGPQKAGLVALVRSGCQGPRGGPGSPSSISPGAVHPTGAGGAPGTSTAFSVLGPLLLRLGSTCETHLCAARAGLTHPVTWGCHSAATASHLSAERDPHAISPSDWLAPPW